MQGWGYQLFADNAVIAGVNALRERDDFNYAWADSEAVRQYTERNGDTYLIPTQMASMVMFYSKKLFDEAGVAYPTDEWTFEEFLDIAQKLTKTDGDKKQWGYQANGAWFRDIHWIRGTGAQEFDALAGVHVLHESAGFMDGDERDRARPTIERRPSCLRSSSGNTGVAG